MRRVVDIAAVALVALVAGRASALERLSFETAVARALQKNPSVTVAVLEIDRARAVVEEVRAASLPALSANSSYTRLDHDRVLNGNVIAGADQFGANLTLAVPIVAPRSWVQWGHAKDNVDVARLSAAEVRRQLAVAVGRTYLAVIAQKHVLEVAERAVATAKAHYDFAHQRFAGGYGTRVDEVRAAQELASNRARVEADGAQLSRLQETLGVLVGVDVAVDAADDAPALAGAPPAADEALRQSAGRADVRLQEGRLEAARRVRKDSWADYLPSLSGSFVPFYQNPPTLTVPEWGWQAQFLLGWSIYDGGLRYGLSHERRAVERQAAAQLEGTRRQAAAEVRTAEEDVRRSTAALTAARDAAANAAAALELTTLGYRAGATTNIEVIDAERQARDAGTAVAAAEDAWRQALLDLLIASGRFPGA